MCDVETGCARKDSVFKNRVLLTIKTLVHAVYFVINNAVSIYGAVMCFTVSHEMLKDDLVDNLKKFAFGYGTNWNYLFQTTFLFLALTHDVLEWTSRDENSVAQKIKYWRDVIFTGLVVPYTCFVFGMFWSLYAIDRELVFPKVYDAVVPWWFNQCVHSNILALVVMETVLQPRIYPTDRRVELAMDMSVGVLYAIVYYSIYFFAGRWLYNVFGLMTWWQVCLFQLLIWTSSYVFYELQWPINRLIHRQEPEPQKEEQKRDVTEQNGGVTNNIEITNDEIKNGPVKHNVVIKSLNGDTKLDDGVNTTSIDFKTPPFSTKSWSLKYRTIRNQFENSHL